MSRPTAAAAVAHPRLGPLHGEGCRPVVLLVDAYLGELELVATRRIDGDDRGDKPKEIASTKEWRPWRRRWFRLTCSSAYPRNRPVPPPQQMATRSASVTVPRGVPAALSLAPPSEAPRLAGATPP
jgi:hypothetical protein